ncbi:Uncharacterized protein PCOAH_00006030 [Plasmodium coatneyi]|uniref:Uncharacterized protein n=1 Tax=Plasmodium coatneyi TaxID=208452 RepID=A0A1B1DTW7_9APIC|nr:Uncharacterized protein PCOAH_00006030 [Plasmodium coatneyi]ANQ06213.1 Uncharacterized protein PCOAH_00006030 [Plasmodium coatneyi]
MEKSLQDFLIEKRNVTQNGVPNMVLSISPNATPSITQEQFNMIMCSIKRKDKNDQLQTAPQMEAQQNVENYYPIMDEEHGMHNHTGMNYIENKIVRSGDALEKTHFPLYVQTYPKENQLHAAQNNVIHPLQELLPPTPLQSNIRTKQLNKKSDHCYCSVGDDVGVNSPSDQGNNLIMMHGKNKVDFISPHADVQRMKNPQVGHVQNYFDQSSTNYSAIQLEHFHKTHKLNHCNNQMENGAKEEVHFGVVNGDFLPSVRSFIVDGVPKIDHVMNHNQGEINIGSGADTDPRKGVERSFCTNTHADGAMTNNLGGSPPSRLFNHARNNANDYDTTHPEINFMNEKEQEVLNEGTMPTDELTSNIHLDPPQDHHKNRDLLNIQNVCNLNRDKTVIQRCDSRVSNQPNNEDRHTNRNYKNVFPEQEGNIFGIYSNCSLVRRENIPVYGGGVEGASEMEQTHQVIHTNNPPTRKEITHPNEMIIPNQQPTNCVIHQSCEKMPHLNNPGKQISLQNAMSLLDDYISKTKINKMLLPSRESSSGGINVQTEMNTPAGTIQNELSQGRYVNPNWSEQPFVHNNNQVNKSNHLNGIDMEKVGRDLHRDDFPLVDKGTNIPHDTLLRFGSAKYRDLHNRIDESKGDKCIGSLNVNTAGIGNCANNVINGGETTYGKKFEAYTNANITTMGNILTQKSCTVTANTEFEPHCNEDHLVTNIDLRNDKQNNSIVSTMEDKSKWLVSLCRRTNNFNVGNSITLNEHVMSTSRLLNQNDKTKLLSGGRVQTGDIPCSHSEEGGGMLLDEVNRIGAFSPEGYFLDSTQERGNSSHIESNGNNYVPMVIPHHAASNPANFLSSANKSKEGMAPLSLMLQQNKQHSICHSVQLNQGEEHHTRCTSNGPPHHHNHSNGNHSLDIFTNNSANYAIEKMGKKALPFDAPMCNMDNSKQVNLLNPIKQIMQPMTVFQFDHHGGACNGTIWRELLGFRRGAMDLAVDSPIGNITGGGAYPSDGKNDNHYDDYHGEGYTSGYPERHTDTRRTTVGDVPPGSKLEIIIQNIRYYSNKIFNDVFMNNDALKKKKLTELNLYLAKLRLKNYQDFFFNLNKFYEMFLLLLNANYVHKFNSSILYSICVVAKNLLFLLHLGVYILHVIKTCLYCVVKLILIKPISISDKAWFFLLNLYKSLFEKLYQYFKSDLLLGEYKGECRDLHTYDDNSLAILLPFINAFNETILEYAKIRIISRNKKKEELIAFPLYESLKPFFFVNTNYPDEVDITEEDEVEVEDLPLEGAGEGTGYTTRSGQATNAPHTECPENRGNLKQLNQTATETTDEASEQTTSLKKTSIPGATVPKRKNSDSQKGNHYCSDQQSGKVDSVATFYSKKKEENDELAVCIRNNILCCVHVLIKMFSHIYINDWDKILYYYNENRKKWIPIFLTLTMNDQNQKIRTNSILCLKYLFDCKQLKYWFLLKEGSYTNAPPGSHISDQVNSQVSYPTGRTRSHEETSPVEYPHNRTNNLTKQIPNGSTTKEIIQLNKHNQSAPIKGDNYLPPSNTPFGKNSYNSAGYTNPSFPDKQTKQNIQMGKEHHPVPFLNDINHIMKREAEIGTNARSSRGSLEGENQMQTYGEVRPDNPVGRSSNCGIPNHRQEYSYERYAKEQSNEKANYCSARKAATEQIIVKLLTQFTKLITRTYMVNRESNFYTPTDRLNICRFFLRVSQSVLIPKYKNLLKNILKFFFFYLLKYLIYFNHGDVFHFCVKKLLHKDGTSKRNRKTEGNTPFGYSLFPYIEQFTERERKATQFCSSNVVCSQTNNNVHLNRHRSEFFHTKQLSDNDFYPHDYLDEDERVFSSLNNYLNNLRDTEEHEESDVQEGEQSPNQRWDQSGGDPTCTGKGLPIHHHRMTHLSLADQEESAKKPKRKSKADMKKEKEERKNTESNNEDGEENPPNDSNKDITGYDKSEENTFEQAEELSPSHVHSNDMDKNGASANPPDGRTDMDTTPDALQLKNKKKEEEEEGEDDDENDEEDGDEEEESTKGSVCSCKPANIIDSTKKIKKVGKKRNDNDLSYLYKHIDKINKQLLSSEDYDLLISILYSNDYSRGSKYITTITVIINIFSVLLCNYNDEIFRFLCTNIYGQNMNRTLNGYNIYCHHAPHNQLYDISFAQLIYFMLIFLYKIFYQPCTDGIDIWLENGNQLVGDKGWKEVIPRGEPNPGDANPLEETEQCQEKENINLYNNSDQEYSLRGHPNRTDRSNANLRSYRYEKKYVNNSYNDLYDNYIISYMQQENNDTNQLNNFLNRNNLMPNLIPYDIQIFKNIFLVFQKTLKHYLFCYMHCWNDVRTLLEYFLQSENVHIKIISIKIVIDIFTFINSYYEVNCSEYELPTYRQKDEYKNDGIFNNTASRGNVWDNCMGEHMLSPQLGGTEELPPCDQLCRKNRSDVGSFKTGLRHSVQRSPCGSVHSRIASAKGVRHVIPDWNTSIGNTSNCFLSPPKGSPTRSASKHTLDHVQKEVPPEGNTNGTPDQHQIEATQMSKKKQFVQLVESDMIELFRKYILIHIHNINKIHNDITNRRSKLKHIFLNTIICISHLSYTGFKILTVDDIQRLAKLVSSCVHSIKCNIITALSKYIIKYIFTFNKKFIQNYEKRINLLHINSTNVYYNNILTTAAGVSVSTGGVTPAHSGITHAAKNESLQNALQKNIKSNAHSVDTFERKCKTNMCTSVTTGGVTSPQVNGTPTNIFIHSTQTNTGSERVSGSCKVCPVLIEEEAKISNNHGNTSPHDDNYTHQGWRDKKDLFENVARTPTRSTIYNPEQVPNHNNSRRSSNSNMGRMARELRQVGTHSACTIMEKLKESVQYEHSSDVTPYSRDTTTSANIGVLNAISEKERKAQPKQQQRKENPVRCISIADSTFKCSLGKPMLEERTSRMSNPGGSNEDQMTKNNPPKLTCTKKEVDGKDTELFPNSSLTKMATNTRNVNKDKMRKLCGLLKRQNRRGGPQMDALKKHENRQREMTNQVNEMNTQRNDKQVLLPPNGEIVQPKKNTEQVTEPGRTRDTCLINSLHVYEKDQGDETPSNDSQGRQRNDAYLLEKQRNERKLFELYYIYIYIIIHIIKFYNDSFVDLKYYTYNCICEIASSYVPFYFTQNSIKTFSYYSNYNSEENKDINKFISFINGIRLSSDVDGLKLFRLRGDTVTGELVHCNEHIHTSVADSFFHKGVTCFTSSSNNTTASSTCTTGRGAPCRDFPTDAGSIPTPGNHPNGITNHNEEKLHDQFSNNIYLISYIEYIYILLLIIRENKNVEKDRAICCIIRYVGFICKNVNFFLFNSISLLPSTFLLKYFMYLNNLVEKKGLLGGGLSTVGRRCSRGSSHGAANTGVVANGEDASKGKRNLSRRSTDALVTCHLQKSNSEMKSTQKCKLYHLFLNVYVKYEYNFEDNFFSCTDSAAKLEGSDGEKEISTKMASSNEDPPQKGDSREGGRRKENKKEQPSQEKPDRTQNISGHAPQEVLNPEHLFQGYSDQREENVHTDPIVLEIKDIFHSSRGKSNPPINKANNNVDAKIILYLLSIVKDHIKNKITWNVLYAFKLIYNNFSFFLAHNFAELHSQILDHLISTLRYTNVYKIKILSSLALIHIPLYYNIDKVKLKELWDTLVTNIFYLDLIFVSDKSNSKQFLCYYEKGINYLTISKKTEYKYKCTLRVNICELLYMCIYRSYVHANINADIVFHNRKVNCFEAFKNYTHIFNINNDVHIYNLTHIFNNHVTYYSFYNNAVSPGRKLPTGTSGGAAIPPNGTVARDSSHSMELRTTSAVRLRHSRSHLEDRRNQVGRTLKKQVEEVELNHHDTFQLQLFLNNHFDKYHFVYKNLLGTGKNPIFQILFQKLHEEIKLSLKRFLEKRKLTSLESPRGVTT